MLKYTVIVDVFDEWLFYKLPGLDFVVLNVISPNLVTLNEIGANQPFLSKVPKKDQKVKYKLDAF